MKNYIIIAVCMLSAVGVILALIGYSKYNQTNNSSGEQAAVPQRETVEIPINNKRVQTPTVEANKAPEFIFDLTEKKFSKILNATTKELDKLVQVKIVQNTYAQEVNAYISVNKDAKKLNVQPEDLNNFKPGLYKLSLKLRTLEGEVNIEQDFTWGVIAVNTKKSIYRPGETAQIGIGVLNNNGETLCLTGEKTVEELNMTIKDPNGQITNFSTKNNTIKDSGKCGPITVTNEADFQAIYQTGQAGIYQMTIEAVVDGEKRQITDYFKVELNPEFDVERTDFPTRIYPKSIYPTAFTITASSNYNGNVTDIVPGFFKIENISDGGKVIKDGDFQKIVWNANLSPGRPKVFTYFIEFPPVSPEFYLLGPITIGNFKEVRQWQIASDAINSTSGLVAYEDNGASQTWSRVWTGTAWIPAPPAAATSMDTSPADSRWFREVSSPKTGEKIVVALDQDSGDGGTADELYVFRWNGSTWSEDLYFNLASGAIDTTRSFDIAYEELSGEALLVYSDGSSSQLLYRLRTGGSWTGPFNAGTSLDSYKKWVRLRAQFESDTILVGYLNNNERTGALIWDGSINTFGSQFEDDDSPAQSETPTSDEEAFDIAIETSSNTPMLFQSTTANTVVYREFTGGAWSGESTLYSGFTNDVEWVTAAADPLPSSNNIAFAFQDSDYDTTEDNNNCTMGVWTGSSVVTISSTITCHTDYDGRINNVAFENNSSRAMWVYATSANPRRLSYRTWTSGGGFTSNTTKSVDLTGDIESLQLHADLNTTSMIALSGDSAGDLNHFEWDGTSWTDVVTDLHSNIQNSGEDAEAYGFGFDRNLEKQAAFRWFANNNGTSVTTALTAQDTPYTLTTANQAFRLRLLLYTPDTVTTSLRNYKLQYVDPGTGTCALPSGGTPSTWTDVPTSGGSTISFNNNATPADGDNLTVNGSLDPTYRGLTVKPQDYEEANNFTNTVSQINADELGLWDFSLVDNTTYDRIAQTYCFRVARSNDVVLQIGLYPQLSTAALPDVLIQGSTLIQGGTRINNP